MIFSFDANPGGTRSGALTIAGQTLTVTQAGSTYVAAQPLTTLVSAGLANLGDVAVDGAGNVYIADYGNNAIKIWTAASNTVTTLVSSGLVNPIGVAVDGVGNVYIGDTGDNVVKKWTAANSNLSTLVSSGVINCHSVTLDGAGNVYIAAPLNGGAIQKWTVATSALSTLVSGLSFPDGAKLDVAGNVYIADNSANAIKKWTSANSNVSVLVSGLNGPFDTAVDGSGNVYFSDSGNNAIKKWSAASNTVTTLVSAVVNYPIGVAVDGTGNLFISDSHNDALKELPYAFVDPTPRLEGAAAGSDALPVVLPATENLLAPFAPTSDQSWLTITGTANGVVGFSFTANNGLSRAAHITVLGQSILVSQTGATPPTLTGAQIMGNGACQFYFTNAVGVSFTVLSTTNLSLALSNWTVAGTASNTAPGQFQFTTPPITNDPQRFYTVRSP